MITVAINAAQFTDAGLTFTAPASGAKVAFFAMPNPNPKGAPIPVGVSTDGTSLFFFPKRSAGQRAVLTALGIGW